MKDRIIAYLKYKKLSQSKFEKSIGMGNGYVNNIRQSIQPDKLLKIAQLYPDINISWLMVGEEFGGPMLKVQEKREERKPESPIEHPSAHPN